MATLPIVSDLLDMIKSVPAALKEIPAKQSDARAKLLDSVTTLGEAVSQALNVVSVRCGSMILAKDDLSEFRQQLVNSPMFLHCCPAKETLRVRKFDCIRYLRAVWDGNDLK